MCRVLAPFSIIIYQEKKFMNVNTHECLSILTLDEAIEGLTNGSIFFNFGKEQIVDWLKELRNYKEADGTMQTDSAVLREMILTEFTRVILSLDDKSLQKVMREIDDEVIIKANKTTSQEVWDKFLQNMTKRKQKMIIEDYEYMGIIRLVDNLFCQRHILRIIYHLMETGIIHTKIVVHP
jgi:flagellar motor switch protein FliG